MYAESPKLIVNENSSVTFNGAQSKRVQDILRPMLAAQVDSLGQLKAQWAKNPNFLLAAVKKWLRKGTGADDLLQSAWHAMISKC